MVINAGRVDQALECVYGSAGQGYKSTELGLFECLK